MPLPKVLIERIDEAAGVTVPVDDRKRDRVAIELERDLAWGGQRGKRALIVDVPGKRGKVIGSEEAG